MVKELTGLVLPQCASWIYFFGFMGASIGTDDRSCTIYVIRYIAALGFMGY